MFRASSEPLTGSLSAPSALPTIAFGDGPSYVFLVTSINNPAGRMSVTKFAAYGAVAIAIMAGLSFLYNINKGVVGLHTAVAAIDGRLEVTNSNIQHLQNDTKETKLILAAAAKVDAELTKEFMALAASMQLAHPMKSKFWSIDQGAEAIKIKDISELKPGLYLTTDGNIIECKGSPAQCGPALQRLNAIILDPVDSNSQKEQE